MNELNFDIRIASAERLLVDIQNFNLPIHRMTVLFGESGIGKSLISRAIYGLLEPGEFTITINGQPYKDYLERIETTEIRKNGFFVFQEPSSHLNPLLPLGAQLREGDLSASLNDLELLKDLWGETQTRKIESLLEVYPKPYRPSGGEKQRMFLAMALKKIDLMLQSRRMDSKSVFIFDEPTGSLDNYFRDVFLALLFKRFQQHHFTTLLITHDYSMVSEITREQKNLLDQISFKELSLRNEMLELRDFQPEVYLGWLRIQQKAQKEKSRSNFDKPLLQVESGAEVFGQQLTISRDPGGKEICPLEIYPGTMTYLKAPSGTGKTTLVKAMMGLISPSRLQLRLDGTTMTERTPRRFWQLHIWGKKMAMVFQHADEALNPRSTIAQTFYGLPSRKRIAPNAIRQILGELFDAELSDEFLRREVSTLSGGQKQRLNLLRSLFLDTDILILDEPLNGLDFESATKVLAMLGEKQNAGKGILVISHNEEIFDTIIEDEHVFFLHSKPVKIE